MRIFLIGMMGAGKTTLGRQLADCLQSPFVDLDEYIEKREQKSIPLLFEEGGPEEFRMQERAALEAVVVEYDKAVIATGGGTPCFFDNMDYINCNGKSIFLNVQPEEIFNRLRATDLNSRPLLSGKTDEELKAFINITLRERLSYYRQAQFILEGHSSSVSELLRLLNIN